MAIVQRSIHIEAPPGEVMRHLADASRWPSWYPGMGPISVTPPFPEKDGQVTFTVKSAGLAIPVTETVLEYDAERLHVFEMEGMLRGRARWELSADGGGTLLTTTWDYSLAGGAVGKLADALVVKRLNNAGLVQGHRNFKALVESA